MEPRKRSTNRFVTVYPVDAQSAESKDHIIYTESRTDKRRNRFWAEIQSRLHVSEKPRSHTFLDPVTDGAESTILYGIFDC